jgi:hypothetical protein
MRSSAIHVALFGGHIIMCWDKHRFVTILKWNNFKIAFLMHRRTTSSFLVIKLFPSCISFETQRYVPVSSSTVKDSHRDTEQLHSDKPPQCFRVWDWSQFPVVPDDRMSVRAMAVSSGPSFTRITITVQTWSSSHTKFWVVQRRGTANGLVSNLNLLYGRSVPILTRSGPYTITLLHRDLLCVRELPGLALLSTSEWVAFRLVMTDYCQS